MNQHSLKISVVTVCYNAVDMIEETILSVINQTYDNVEYIIIDGGSTDGTADIIKKYADHIAYWVSEPDEGIYDAMNKGIAVATGDYINFMNAGDKLVDNTILSYYANIATSNEATIIYGPNYKDIVVPEKLIMPYPFFKSKKKVKPMGICHQSILVKTNIAKKYQFNKIFNIAADYDMIFRLYKDGHIFLEGDKAVSVFSTNGLSYENPVKRFIEVAIINGYSPYSIYIYTRSIIIWLKFRIRKFLIKICMIHD